MPIDFPPSPSVNDTVTAGDKTWRWNGSTWESVAKTFPAGVQGLQGATGAGGVQAARGVQGIRGLQGATGLQGAQGSTGAQGAQGFNGTQGLTAYSKILPHVSGNYYTSVRRANNDVTNPNANRTFFTPFFVPNAGFYDRIACRTTANHTSTTSTIRMGIFNNDGGGLPSTVLLDAGQITCSAASTTYAIPINQFLNIGFYWLAWNRQDTSTTAEFSGVGNIESYNGLLGLPYGTAVATIGFAGRAFGYIDSHTTTNVPQFTTITPTSMVFPNNITGAMIVLRRV